MEQSSDFTAILSKMSHLQSKNKDLLHQNEQLEQLIEMVAEGMMVIDKAEKIVFVNSAMEKILGYKKTEIIGCSHCDSRWRFSCQDSADVEWTEIFNLMLTRGQIFEGNECVMEEGVNKDKIYRVNAQPHRNEQEEIDYILVMIRDVTEQSNIQQENKELKNVYERLVEYADEAIFRIQAISGQVTYINAAAQKILGYRLDEYLSDPKLPLKIINKEYIKNWFGTGDELLNGKDALKNVVVECTTKDGRTIVFEFTSIAVRDHNHKVIYFETVGRDITVRRFMEAELAKSQKLESIGLLAGGIAHDFNNILTALLGCISLAKMELNPEVPVYKRLIAAEEHSLRAKSLTRRLLTYSRGGSPLRKTASIARVIQEAVDISLSGKNNQCEFSLPGGLWQVQIDESQMHQVVHSLVTNALEAMPQGGTIDIGAENVVLTQNQVPSLRPGRYVKWYVRDQGIGISPEHLKKLFDPYFTTKQMGSVKGMGLGLAISYSIVKSHEGIILVKSNPGIGTTFTVYIPAVGGEASMPVPSVPEAKQPGLKQKIMLIDDEQFLLDVTSSMLTHLGYDVTAVKNHAEALDIYRRKKEAGEPYSLIIMDLTMRGDDYGEIAIRRWLSIDPKIKAIISSGYAGDPVIDGYWEYGFAGAMVKPYSLTELKQTIEKVLAG